MLCIIFLELYIVIEGIICSFCVKSRIKYEEFAFVHYDSMPWYRL